MAEKEGFEPYGKSGFGPCVSTGFVFACDISCDIFDLGLVERVNPFILLFSHGIEDVGIEAFVSAFLRPAAAGHGVLGADA